jgi:cytochrome d ubiquinol oxidase subunit II
METFWFCAVAGMIAAYAVLDGFDLGAGILHLLVARSDGERRLVLNSIGPVWDGNEVWLVAAGGVLYLAFPLLYAASFSGFYLPLIIVLWLLMLRGVAIEFRHHIDSPVWRPFWDGTFSLSSALLAIFFGAALGNVVRGVPLGAEGTFFEPLWTDFGLAGSRETGILDWYTVTVGMTALAVLTAHGGLWVALKTEGPVRERARRAAARAWWAIGALTFVITFATFRVQPQVLASLEARPWLWLFPAVALSGLAGMRWYQAAGRDRAAFLASCAYIVGILSSAAAGLYPHLLPSNLDPAHALTIRNASAPAYALGVGLVWWIPGMALAAIYFTYAYRRFAGKVRVEGEGY